LKAAGREPERRGSRLPHCGFDGKKEREKEKNIYLLTTPNITSTPTNTF